MVYISDSRSKHSAMPLCTGSSGERWSGHGHPQQSRVRDPRQQPADLGDHHATERHDRQIRQASCVPIHRSQFRRGKRKLCINIY